MFTIKGSLQKISLYAGFLEGVGYIIIVSTVLTWIVRWTQDRIFFLTNVDFWIPFLDRCLECLQTNSIHYLKEMSGPQRLLGFVADGISMAILITAIYYAIRLMRCFRHGEIFSLHTICLLKNISKLALLWALYGPINIFIMSNFVLTTSPEQRALTMAFATDDVILKLIFFGFFFVIALMMQEGYRLKSEQDLTV